MENKSKYNSKVSPIPIYILMILKEKSSISHPLSRKEITEILINKYHLDHLSIDDRRTIPKYIKMLMENFSGAIIEKPHVSGGTAKWYLNPKKIPALGGEILTAEETNIFIDMVASSKIISDEYTHSMIHKITALLNDEDKDKINTKYVSKSNYKCENKQLIETKNTIEKAIDNYVEISFLYNLNGKPERIIAFPQKIVTKDDEVYLNAFLRNDTPFRVKLKDISKVEICENLDEIFNVGLESKYENVCNLETLLSNIRVINEAIHAGKTLRFRYLNYVAKGNVISIEPANGQKEVYPSGTAYKNGKHYLIAYDTTDYTPVFFRTDLMTDIQIGDSLDFWERKKFDFKEAHELLDRHPYMLPGFSKMTARFLINEKSLDRVIDTFGNKAVVEKTVDPIDTLSEGNLKKLANTFKDKYLESFTGHKKDDSLVQVTVKTDEEEMLRFSLENADVVEILSPEHLRLRVLEISETLSRRYSKTDFDLEQDEYKKILNGDDYLTLGSDNDFDRKILKLISRRKEYDRVRKIEIENFVPYEELIKYNHAKHVVISGTGLMNFDFLRSLPSLKSLTLVNTSIDSGDVLAPLPPLESLFIHRNNRLNDYGFLKKMKVENLYIGRNGSDDLSVLYELDNVTGLVIEEGVLETMDVKKLMAIENEDGHHISVRRWIDVGARTELPKSFRINYRMLRDV